MNKGSDAESLWKGSLSEFGTEQMLVFPTVPGLPRDLEKRSAQPVEAPDQVRGGEEKY